MEANNGDAKHESGDKDGTDACQKNNKDGECREECERLEIGESAAKENERAISGAEEVQEGPRTEKANEEDERERVREERHREDHRNNGVVVDAKVGVVFANAECGFRERFRLGECGAVDELRPGTALLEAVAEVIGDVVDERSESRGRSGSLGSGDGAAGCGGGWSVRYGQDGRGGGGHGLL